MPDRIDFEGMIDARREAAAERFVRERLAAIGEERYQRMMIMGEWIDTPTPAVLAPIVEHDHSFVRGISALGRTMERIYGNVPIANRRTERTISLPIKVLESSYTLRDILGIPLRTVEDIQGKANYARGDEVDPPKRADVVEAMEYIAPLIRGSGIEFLKIPGRIAQVGFDDEVAIYVKMEDGNTIYYDVENDDYYVATVSVMKKKVGAR